jgi:L-amino acid N-acyltransferase YncA
MLQIKDATLEDATGITSIYNDAVLNTTAIWNDNVVEVSNRIDWIIERKKQAYPVLVAQDHSGNVLGYASFGDWRAFEGYKHTVEHSIYVRGDARGKGVGKQLLGCLIERARQLNKHVMVAGIEASNAPSIALHKGFGFVQTGLLPEVGTKFGKWLDLAFLQLILKSA